MKTVTLLAFVLMLPWAAVAEVSDDDCLSCHTDASKVTRALIDGEEVGRSVHQDLSCTECHDTVTAREHPRKLPKVNCAGCHEDEDTEFKESVHGLAKIDAEELQPSCAACHGTHLVLGKKKPDSKVHRANLKTTCGHCHSDPRMIARAGRHGQDPIAVYLTSIHSRPPKDKPQDVIATCVDCHGPAHSVVPSLHPKSTTNKFAIADTCGRCHTADRDAYFQSGHWQALKSRGHWASPSCTDCHGEHLAAVPGGENRDERILASTQLCANCHSNQVLMSRFGLDARRLSSYMMTYHGLAVLRGSADAASCTSCHEVHAIRSAADPKSSVHPANLEATCAKCHPDANPSFVQISVHPLNQQERNPVAYMVRVAYIWIIALTIGGMLLHNLVIVFFYLRQRWRVKRDQPQVERFNAFQVVQHFVLFLSFSTLAVTGFALTFPDSWWVRPLTALGLSEPVRALIHRISAVVLVAGALLQALYFVFWRGGRREIRALIPTWSDVVAFIDTMRYYMGLRAHLPPAGRYDYTEKAEYLALIWGTAVMAVTGFILWFPQFFSRFLPISAFEVAEVIHFFEAMLAVLAIIVWHLFFTIFHPEKYPMSLTWIDGKISEAEQAHHHGLEGNDPASHESEEQS